MYSGRFPLARTLLIHLGVVDESWVLLGEYRSGELRATYEARGAHLQGPQQACHGDALEISLLEHGVEHSRLDGRMQVLTGGQYALIAPGVEHSSWTTSRPALECNVHLPVSMLRQVADELAVRWSGVRWPSGTFAADPECAAIMQALRHELTAAQGCGRNLVMTSLGVSLTALLLRRHVMDGTAEPADPTSAAARLANAEELMRAAFSEPFSLDDLATAAQMSRYHFLRSFKKHYGMTPCAYLNRLRVDRAAELARATELPLTTIAFEVGFSSSGRLSEAFKRVHGVPPSQWRRGTQVTRPCGPSAAICGEQQSNEREAPSAACA